jgi:hypothetical protein
MALDESSVYTLATRLIPTHGRSDRAVEPRLVAGRMPDDLPFPLPVPPGATVIGASVEDEFVMVVLDTDLSPRGVVAFYRDALPRAGWEEPDSGRSRGGFEQAAHGHAGFIRQGAKLWLNAHAYPGRLTDVRLALSTDQDEPAVHAGRHPIPRLPELAPPVGARLRKMGGEGSPTGTSDTAELITSLDLAAIADHYSDQVREAGCIERDRGQGDLLAWSTWELDDPDHGPSQGLFLALQQLHDPTRYFLYERISWAPPSPEGR